MKKLIIIKRCSQTLFLLLFVYILWSTTHPLRGLLPPETFFRINPLIIIFTSISERLLLPGIGLSLLMLLLTGVFGRFFCGFVCPLGTTIDAVGVLRKNTPVASDKANRKLRKPKFFILGAIAVFAILGTQIAWIFDPMVIMARFVSLNLIPTTTLVLDKLFVALIRNFELYGPVYDFYRSMKSSFLGIDPYYFSNSSIIFYVFLIVTFAALFLKRAWCRMICPLGALYALAARFSVLRRTIEKCTTCGMCKSRCRMGAIKDDMSYIKGECILCMDCVYDCPSRITKFNWPNTKKKDKNGPEGGISRRNFLVFAFSSLFLPGLKVYVAGPKTVTGKTGIIRPPGASKEERLLSRCIRCGNCMKVCITNGLQPVMFESGFEGMWTPRLIPEIGYCEYNCTLCGNVCPTGAIPRLPLAEKKRTKLGIARVDRGTCLAWEYKTDCIVCEEHCPVPEKAIKLEAEIVNGRELLKPVVDRTLCIGCGICQNKCPQRPVRSIRVYQA
ncbi:MAG: 4Fe-4S binding protein [Candidatus Omnitrophota bacterium]